MKAGRTWVLLVVGAMLVLGALTLTQFQTQQLFRDSQIAFQEGGVPRNDGAILSAAILIGAGVALFLALGSARTPLDRIVPSLIAGVSATLLVIMNFTIFVNSIILRDEAAAHFTASFAFRHSEFVEPLHVAIPAVLTVLLLLMIGGAAWYLYSPVSYRSHLGSHAAPGSLRNASLVSGLLLAAATVFFIAAFLRNAIDLEAADTSGEMGSAILLYYLLVLALVLVLLVVVAKTVLITWRQRWFPKIQQPYRVLQSLTIAEYWVIALVIGLDLLVLATTEPAASADDPLVYGDVVFVYTDRGVAFLLLLASLPYALYALTTHRAHRGLLPPTNPGPRFDTNARYAAWTLGGAAAILYLSADAGILPRFIMVTSYVALLTGLRAFHFRLRDGVPSIAVRSDAGPFAVTFLALAWTSGLMLWGMGNTIEAQYVTNGEVVSLTDAAYQRFSVAFRFLGSLSFALGAVLALDSATQWNSPRKLGPTVLVLFGLIVGTHLLFPITYQTAFDPDLVTTDVMVGFASVAQEAFTRTVIIFVWSGLALSVVGAASRILTAGRPNRD